MYKNIYVRHIHVHVCTQGGGGTFYVFYYYTYIIIIIIIIYNVVIKLLCRNSLFLHNYYNKFQYFIGYILD